MRIKSIECETEKSRQEQEPRGLPEEDFELLDRGDFLGLEYLRVSRLRSKRNRTAAERKFLKEHDGVEAQIQNDPEGVLKKALAALDEGSTLLLKLIRSRRLFHDYAENSWDEALDSFAPRIGFLNRQLIRLAEEGTPLSRFHLWYEAVNLTDAVVRLAAAFPEDFRRMAESSLTMPSLRSRSSKFSCDADTIAKAIHLAEKHAAPDIHDNRSRIGALCHFLVAQLVGDVQAARNRKEHFERSAKLHNSQEIIPNYFHSDWRQLYEESWKLPELRGHADEWWKGRVRTMVKREFERMRKNSTHNPALWQELSKTTDQGTDKARWHTLEKYCLNKLRQIAGKTSNPG